MVQSFDRCVNAASTAAGVRGSAWQNSHLTLHWRSEDDDDNEEMSTCFLEAWQLRTGWTDMLPSSSRNSVSCLLPSMVVGVLWFGEPFSLPALLGYGSERKMWIPNSTVAFWCTRWSFPFRKWTTENGNYDKYTSKATGHGPAKQVCRSKPHWAPVGRPVSHIIRSVARRIEKGTALSSSQLHAQERYGRGKQWLGLGM